jgi:hypothetical protein
MTLNGTNKIRGIVFLYTRLITFTVDAVLLNSQSINIDSDG